MNSVDIKRKTPQHSRDVHERRGERGQSSRWVVKVIERMTQEIRAEYEDLRRRYGWVIYQQTHKQIDKGLL